MLLSSCFIQKRKIHFWIFLNEITTLEFDCLGTFQQPQKEYPFSTEIIKTDKTSQKSIQFFASLITQIAEKHNGIYQNWETIPVSNEEEWQEYLKLFTE